MGSKPSLSELASMSHVAKKVYPTNQPKLNLAELAKLNLNQPTIQKSGINPPRPSLADLAKVNSKSKSKVHSETRVLEVLAAQPAVTRFNLSSALRSKCNIADKRTIPTLKGRKSNQENILFTPISAPTELVDPALVAKKASRVGRVITKPAKPCPSMFLKFDLKNRLKLQMSTIEPFTFDSPSPDDIIQRRLRTVKKE